MLNLRTFLFISTLIFTINAICPHGYFTKNSDCDTQVIPIQCQKYTSELVPAGNWGYFYLSLHGIEEDIELEIVNDGWKTSAFIEIQPFDLNKLPNHRHYDFRLDLEKDKTMIKEIPVDRRGGNLVIGVFNSASFYSDLANVKIRFFAKEGDCKRPLPLGMILGVIGAIGAVFAIIKLYSYYKQNCLNRRTEEHAIAHKNTPRSGPLSAKEFQEYFPKMPFETLENPFHETTCSVCLEEFVYDAICRQFHCSHIFHDKCVQSWLLKHNNCPSCRVDITKAAIEEFLRAKARETDTDTENIGIKDSPVEQNPREHENIVILGQGEALIEDEASKLEKISLL